MKITCETTILNRQFPQAKPRAQKSTVAIGTHPPNKENTEFFVIIFNSQHKTGLRYKLKDNIQRVFTKFIDEGKIQIQFKEPEYDLQLKGDPVQVKAFINVLKLALQGKKTNDNGQRVISHVTAVTKHDPVKTKLVIHSRKDYPIKGLPRTLTHLEMSEMKWCRVDNQVYLLKNLTHLDLNTNLIDKIPTQLGALKLQEINFASNKLAESSWKWLTGKELSNSLHTLNLSDNALKFFPFELTKLKNLAKLVISKNFIQKVPFAIRNLRFLRHLDLSSNKLESLPQNLTFLKLDLLNVCDNAFPYANLVTEAVELPTKIPSMFEVAARKVISQCIPYSPKTIPLIICEILEASPLCHCGKLCVDPKIYYKHGRLNNLRCASVAKDHQIMLLGDFVFCSRKCASKYSPKTGL
ncbi:leucine-rich repeat protein 1 [Culicoides brevitarsis]|uniref:leucine-rich repeat protein 1 n=1 Tax=Culicoides brevitarsis TaxID=469753 RepID=UPI00307C29EB